VLFVALRGTGVAAQAANFVALVVTAVGNTAANRRMTFGISGRRHAARHQLQGLAVFALCLGLTSGALAALHTVIAAPARSVELAVLLGANLAATLARFLLLRRWVFARTPPLSASRAAYGLAYGDDVAFPS